MNGKIELLAPAGDWDSFIAAVENGADAVYLGGKLFNARQSAGNFDAAQLKNALYYAHVRGVSIYLTMNTLLSDDEMKQALQFAEEAYCMGIDGIIVQDLGLAALLKKVLPGLSLHASTQMTIYNLEGVKILENLGFKRVVLARELSLEEIRHITDNAAMEIEVFAHGALCISYSGQCLMSSIIGGRSGNRGRCAQPCRLPYSLGDSSGYLLSPWDMCSLDLLPQSGEAGVKALKIAGRMNTPEYVATVVRIYRKYIDMGPNDFRIAGSDMKDLMQIFNRGGFTTGYLAGKAGRDMMSYEKPKNWGVFLGNVTSYDRAGKTFTVKLEEDLSIGDGIEVWNGEDPSPGTIVTMIKSNNRNTSAAFKGDTVRVGDLSGNIRKGDRVYKTSDKGLITSARETFAGKYIRKSPLKCKVLVKRGVPPGLKVWDRDQNTVEIKGEAIPEEAINKPLTEERIVEQLAKTGNTPFSFEDIAVELDEGLSVPVSELNNLRRSALDEVERLRALRYDRCKGDTAIEPLEDKHGDAAKKHGRLKVSVYFYDLRDDIDFGSIKADRAYLPFTSFLKKENLVLLEEFYRRGIEVFAWLPAVTRGNYDRLISEKLPDILGAGPNGVLAGNTGHIEMLKVFSGIQKIGDHSLNIFNSFSMREASELGLNAVTLSLELTVGQIEALAGFTGMEREAAVYGRLPLMTSEYCPVGSLVGGMGAGAECRHACRGGLHRLKDRKGMEFPVLCDRIDCRATIINSNVLFVPDIVERLKAAGVDSIRLYVSDESPEEVLEVVGMYCDIADNGTGVLKKYGSTVERVRAGGFTRGHYFRGV